MAARKKIETAHRSAVKATILCFACIFKGLLLCAQDTTVTLNLNRQPFSVLVEQIEATTPYHFYYHSPDVDSFFITVQCRHEPVRDVLKRIFENTVFSFFTDPFQNIYISKQALIATLPQDFFDKTSRYSPQPVNPSLATDTTHVRRLKSSVENRLFEIGNPSAAAKAKVTLAGYVRESRSGEPLSGVSVTVDSLPTGVSTDAYGYYSLTVAPGHHVLHIMSFGMTTTRRQVLLHGDGRLDIEMNEYVPSLKEVVVTATRLSNVRSVTMGKSTMTIQTVKQIPVVFGEPDLLRAVLTLPGVTSVGEANTGLNVRGGAADQNLILLNDATIYNPSHLFGFFSSFNPDVVKSAELYKGAIPEKYGGRLSSVLDVTTRQGNTKKITGIAGLGPLTSKITVEGPIANENTTFIASARSSYSNWLLRQVPDRNYRNSSASFYDFDWHLSHNLNQKNSLFLNIYVSHDGFRFDKDTMYRYGNRTINLKWKHNFNNRFSSLTIAGFDAYDYTMESQSNPVNSFDLSFGVHQNYFKEELNYAPGLKHVFSFGLNSIYYHLQPGSLKALGSASLVAMNLMEPEQALESAVYIGDQYTITPALTLNAGLRYSLFNYLGPHELYDYLPAVPRDQNTITDTSYYGKGKIISTYHDPEIRMGMRLSLGASLSLKLGLNTTAQYIHTLSNTNAISPVDILKLSDSYLKPQQGSQLSAGLYRNFHSNTVEASVEVYYKRLKHYLDFKSGASLLLNQHIETDVIDTRGKAYGLEVFVKKSSGKLTGWVSYTYCRTLLQSENSSAGEVVNSGRYYPANFDKPHIADLTGNYKFSHRYNLSLNLSYSTGRPITLPIAIFNLAGAQRVYYSQRNQFRTPDYFRADFSFTLEGNHKLTKPTHNDWTFGIYNLSGRKNVYSIYFKEENGTIKGYQLSIFGSPIPFVTYSLRF